MDLLLARFGLHVAAVALRAAVLVVSTAHRLQGRGGRILSGGHGMRLRRLCFHFRFLGLKYQPIAI